MSFAKWKARNKVMDACIPDGYKAMAYRVSEAAYKAVERAGMKKYPKPDGLELAALLCHAIGAKRRAYASEVEHKADLYRAEGAEECAEALK